MSENNRLLPYGISHRKPAVIFLGIAVIFAMLLTNLQTTLAQGEITDTPTAATTPDTVLQTPDGEILPGKIFPTPTPAPTNSWQPPLVSEPLSLGLFDHFYFFRPIGIDSVNWALQAYLYGYDDPLSDYPHSGLDFDAPLGTDILAAASGKVVFTGYGLASNVGNTKDPYGLAVVIRHDFSYYGYTILTVYAHMEKILVELGQRVDSGEQIGVVGMTGNTSGPHVHFEVRLEKDNIFYVQNPYLWMSPPIDHGVLAGRFVDANNKYLTSRTIWIKSLSTNDKWTIETYSTQDTPNDPYYRENVALGDLPAGKYELTILSNYQYYTSELTINPGMITFVSFKYGMGFQTPEFDASELTGFSTPGPK